MGLSVVAWKYLYAAFQRKMANPLERMRQVEVFKLDYCPLCGCVLFRPQGMLEPTVYCYRPGCSYRFQAKGLHWLHLQSLLLLLSDMWNYARFIFQHWQSHIVFWAVYSSLKFFNFFWPKCLVVSPKLSNISLPWLLMRKMVFRKASFSVLWSHVYAFVNFYCVFIWLELPWSISLPIAIFVFHSTFKNAIACSSISEFVFLSNSHICLI